MALDFPNSPVNGQKHPQPAVAGQPVYTYDGEKWKAVSGGSNIPTIMVSDSPPPNPPDNALWWESDSGLLYLRYSDGDTSQWVIAAPQPDIQVLAPLASPVFTGDPKAPTPATADNDTSIATTAFVKAQGYAPLADPALTGNPTAPTPAAADNDTSIATTAFVKTADAGGVRWDAAQTLTAPQREQARQNVYAAPFDAMAYGGIQVNGGMDIAQQFGTTGASTSGSYVADCWRLDYSGTGIVIGAAMAQSATKFPGFPSYLFSNVLTAKVTLASGDYAILYQSVEGLRVARLAWGTANAQPITICFWSAHHRTGLYSFSVNNVAPANRSYVAPYTQVAADVPQYNVVTVPGDTAGTWGSSNATAINCQFTIAYGGGALTAPSTNSWQAGNYVAASGQVNGVGTTADLTTLAGFIIIPGIEAPSAVRSPFIMRHSAEEIRVCQRYFRYDTYSTSGLWFHPLDLTNAYRRVTYYFNPPMRIAPAVTIGGGTASGSAFAASNPRAINITTSGCELQGDLAGAGYSYCTSVMADARL